MKRLCYLLAGGLLLTTVIISCEQGPKPMDAAAIEAKADSVARSQMQAIAEASMIECNANQAMMVQMKADSLYNAAVAAMNH